jgi:iron complex outermembrane receptor protein
LDNVERIEIVSGPASALYGANAFNGIINIITRNGKTNPGNHVSATYGAWEKKVTNTGGAMSFSTRGKVGFGEDAVTYSVGGYYYKTDGPNLGKANHLDKLNYNQNDAAYGIESRQCGGTCIPNDKSVGRYWSPTYNNSKEDTYNLTAQFTRGNFRFQTVNWQYLQGEGTFGNGTNQIDTYQKGLESDNYDLRNNIRRIGIAKGVASPQGYPGSHWDTKSNSLRTGYLYKFSPKLNLDSELITRSTQLLSSSGESYPNTTDPGAYYRTGDFTTANKYARPDYGYQLEEKMQYEPNTRLSTTFGMIGRQFVLAKDFGSQERITYNTYGVYFQQVYKLGSYISFTGGYRYDLNTIYGKASTPRFSIIWNPIENLTFKFLIGTGFREPTIKELYGFTAQRKQNPNLQPERLRSYEVGASYRFLKRFYISTHSYYNRITNLILETTTRDSNPINGISPSGGAWQQNQNSGDAKVYALESSFDFQFTQSFILNFNHTYSKGYYDNLPRAQSTSPSTYGRDGDNPENDLFLLGFKQLTGVTIIPNKGPIPNIPLHKANIGFTWYPMENLSLYLGANYIDIRRTRSTNPEKATPGYTMLKVNIRWENFFTDGMFLQFHVNNFGNEQFYDPGIRAANGYYYPTRHPLETRNFWITVGYNF